MIAYLQTIYQILEPSFSSIGNGVETADKWVATLEDMANK
jgi:hypothetical protein